MARPVSGTGTGWILLALVFFRVVLDLCYYLVVSPLWRYSGFDFCPDWFKALESYVLLIVVFLFLPKRAARLTDFLIWMLVLVAYVPMLTLFALAGADRVFTYGAAGFWVEGGEIRHPVEEVTIAGNLAEMFSHIVAVGSDEDERSSLKTGSVLVESMKLAGH